MKNQKITFETQGRSRQNIAGFSVSYQRHLAEIEKKIREHQSLAEPIEIEFIRINGDIRKQTGIIRDFQNHQFSFGQWSKHESEMIWNGSIVRTDNVFGEVPIFFGFSYRTIFDIGKSISMYKEFMETISVMNLTDKHAVLSYRNDDGSFSKIDCMIVRNNKSNFQTLDFRETLIKEEVNVAVSLSGTTGIEKYHRFVSDKGYLYEIEIMESKHQISGHDDGEVFGEIAIGNTYP